MNRVSAVLKGVLCVVLVVLYAVLALTPVMLIAIVKWIVPSAQVKRRCTSICVHISDFLIRAYAVTYRYIHKPNWDVEGLDGLSPQHSYLVICNHQSWSDIPILVFLLIGKVPFFKFFLKKVLIWLPFIGVACWALDFPFMRRYSKEELANNPELRGKDLETTRRLCEQLKGELASVVNFAEGTRFTEQKKARQNSPYQYLLKPKSGGIASVASMLGDQLVALVDVTIVYPEGRKGFWHFLSGRIEKVVVRVKQRDVPAHLLMGDYQTNEQFRSEFQEWVASLWLEKDQLIATHMRDSGRATR